MVAYLTEINDDNYDQVTSDGVVLVDVYANWCSPCKQVSPLVDKLSEQYQGKLKVAKLDADSNPQSIEKLSVRSIPTLLFYKDGKIVEKLTGLQNYSTLSNIVEKYIN